MTDPNGDTCAWLPGNDGFCPSDSGGSKPKHIITYHSGTGVTASDHVRLAMTRSETGERPYLETAVFVGVEPEHTPVLLDGEPMPGTIVPQLAAIDDVVYLAWSDMGVNTMVGAPLHPDGTVIAEEIVNLGARSGALRRLGDRFLFVFTQSTEIRGTWIDRDGSIGNTIVLANPASSTSGIDVSNDGASGALAITYHTYDEPTDTRGLSIARVAADGSHRDTTIATFGKYESITYVQAVATSDGGALAVLGFLREGMRMPSIARVDPDGTVRVQPTKIDSVIDLVRNGAKLLALSSSGTGTASVLDEQGTVLSGPFVLNATAGVSAFATGAGFTAIHGSTDAPVSLTSLDASGFPAPPVVIAETTEDGCGCRTTNSPTAGIFVVVGGLVLRRRRFRGAA